MKTLTFLKVDWAEVAVRTLQNLLLGREDGFTTHDIDKLLSNYACKALDFPYAPREKSRSDSVISLQDDQCPAQDSCPSTPSRMGTPPPTAGSTPMHTSSSSSSLDRGSTGRRIQRSPISSSPQTEPRFVRTGSQTTSSMSAWSASENASPCSTGVTTAGGVVVWCAMPAPTTRWR
ncbi:zinc finger FYVE domain-containing protein 26-like [Oncorhynchus tshawytscha]|uniref:zinc finger FYVE domain-containing protein 26-like n=1 Tax=Oncorhynchus tshawytscha TaxID=74940 RepID=UPI001C3DFDC0|nr:zinc finger FYVE domain-containing protein 26-like [Oncorhynchus tshawytscha]